MENKIQELVLKIKDDCPAGVMISTAESCTGGMIAKFLTDVPGSSTYFERGFVTYSNEAKIDLLGVAKQTLTDFGAVSEAAAAAMAKGCLQNSQADFALSVTGIAGPDGGSKTKPVGLVYFGISSKKFGVNTYKHIFIGDRNDVRHESAYVGLSHLYNEIMK